MSKRVLWALALIVPLFAALSVFGQERGRGRGGNVTLPEGPGREIVQAQCASCHGLNLITNSGYARDEWISLFTTMVALPQDQVGAVADYLAKNFPEKPRPRAVIIPGPVNVSIREWIVPSLGSRPHDPLVTPDGTIWWTGQFASVIGRLDPRTGQLKEFKTKTPGSGPHGLTAVKEYELPAQEARPRRIAISSDDAIWYADYARGYLGRLDTKSGKVSEWPSPGGPQSLPYGIASIHDVIWYSESGVKPNTIARFDPKTEKFQTWAIPSGGGVVRNVSVTRDGNLALACSGVNRVALVEIKDGGKTH